MQKQMTSYMVKNLKASEMKEPENWSETVISIAANLMEEFFIVILMVIAGGKPSFVSLVIVVLTLPILYKKEAMKEQSLAFSQTYSKFVLIPLILGVFIKTLIITFYLAGRDVALLNKNTLDSWGFALDQKDPGSSELDISVFGSLQIELAAVLIFLIIYVLSSLISEDIRVDNGLMVKGSPFSRGQYIYYIVFLILVIIECMIVQNLINFIILVLGLVNLLQHSIKGSKKNSSFNKTVVAIFMSLMSFQFILCITLQTTSVQAYIMANPEKVQAVIVILGSFAFMPSDSQNSSDTNHSTLAYHINLLIFSILLASIWRSARQASNDFKLRDLHYVSSSRARENQSFNTDLETSTNSVQREKRLKKLGQGLLNNTRAKYQPGFNWIEFKNEFFSLKPWTLTWIACFGEILIAYAYNNKQGLVHLSWALITCILPLEITIHISCWLMGPFLFLLFLLMYTTEMRKMIFTPAPDSIIQELSFKLTYPAMELSYLFAMVSIFALMYNSRQFVGKKNQVLRNGLFKRIKSETQSIFFCFAFIFLRHMHILVLLILFIIGVGEISFYNIGLMFFFIIFSVSQDFYRKSGFILIFFLSTFIWGQYLWTLIYGKYTDSSQQGQTYQILKLINWVHDVPKSRGTLLQYDPPYQYWIILILGIILSLVNSWFQDPKEIQLAEQACDEKMTKRYPKFSKITKRAGYIIKELIIFFIVIFMAIVISRQQPNLINFLFMCICFIFLGYILAGDQSTYKVCVTLCKILKTLSGIILILSVTFYLITDSKVLNNISFDETILREVPHLVMNSDIIGFSNFQNNQTSNQKLWRQLASYLFFLFVANILQALYESQINSLKQEDNKDMKKIFEDEAKVASFHEKNRFTVPYIVYKFTHYWSILDQTALYFHIPINMVIVGFAIYYEVSLFMALNIICIVIFYVYSALLLHKQTNVKYLNLEDKLGLDKAYKTSKGFRLAASKSFMDIRRKLWYFQYFFLILSLILIYPSPIFDKLMKRYPSYYDNFQTFLFYFFWGGFYKGQETRMNFSFIVPQFTLIILLIIEKIAQRWLLGRFGCSLQNIAYFRESEIRIELLRKSQEKLPEYEETKLPESTSNFVTQGEARKVVNDIKKKFTKVDDDARIEQLKQILEANIKRQTNISRAKTLSIMIQQLSLLCLLLSCAFKSNIISCVHVVCILVYVVSKSKTNVMPFIITVIGICFMAQYLIYLLNLYEYNCPQDFPFMFGQYPSQKDPYGKYLFPVFAKFEYLRDIDNAYFFAMGLQQQTLRSLWLDLINLFLMTIYFLEFRNPILRRSVVVSWKQTQTLYHQGEEIDKQDALDEYKRLLYQKNPNEDKVTHEQRLEELREKVPQFAFFKGASVMTYCSSHIFTMVIVFLLAILGRSLISLGYLLILLPYLITNLNFFRFYSKYEKRKWSFVLVLTYVLILYSFLDFLVQVIFQFPFFKPFVGDITIGLQKVWQFRDETLTYDDLINKQDNLSLVKISGECVAVLFTKCAIIFFLNLQKEIFNSVGFQHFVERHEKGVKRLMEIRKDKALSVTYNYNNLKLRQIVTMQKKKKQNFEVVKELKQKLKYWRERHYDQVAQQVFPITFKEEEPSLKSSLIETIGQAKNSLRQISSQTSKKQSLLMSPIADRDTAGTIFKSIFKAKKKIEMFKQLRKVKKELPLCAKFFQCLTKRFTNHILFIENKQQMAKIKTQLENGEIAMFTILEQKLLLDIKIWLRAKEADNVEESMFKEADKNKESNSELKLENMRHTQEFISFWNLTKHLFNNLGQIVASNTNIIAYVLMIVSMYLNASLLSIGYPLLVFGYALLEETRPGKKFWNLILYYTLAILLLKFNYQFFNTQDTTLEQVQRELKLGLQEYKDSTFGLFKYVITEILILYFVLAHKIHSKLLGLYSKTETEIEPIKNAIYRSLNHDPKKPKDETPEEEFKREFQEEREKVQQKIEREELAERIIVRSTERPKEELQNDISENFFFDQKRKRQRSKIDNSFCFDQEDLSKQIQRIKEDKRKKKIKGFFERWKYFQRLFPTMKAQKPGSDLYLFNSIILFVIFFYIMFYYDAMVASGIYTGQKSALSFNMVLLLIFHIGLLIMERIISRTHTKVTTTKSKLKSSMKSFTLQVIEQKQWNSMSMHLKTIRRGDQDLSNKEAQDAIKDFGELDQAQDDNDTIEIDKTIITNQQKSKFIIHWIMLILVHLAIFWYYPIQGNFELYGEVDCSTDLKHYPYGCKNFSSNQILQNVYILYLLYFVVSALQIKYGLPQQRVVTTTARDSDFSYVCHLIYSGSPWIMELKVMIDFMFTKTAMDIFQWWQMDRYHSEMYIAKMGNRNYYQKKLGVPIQGLEKIIFGCCFLFAALFLIISPLILFSDVGATSAPNLVLQSQIEINLIFQDKTQGSLVAPLSYNIYKTQNPFISTFDQAKFSEYNFTKYPETKFFNYDQVQSVKPNKYSDLSWEISEQNLNILTDQLDKQFHDGSNFNVVVQLKYAFQRNGPSDNKVAIGTQEMTLDMNDPVDKLAIQEMIGIKDVDCGQGYNFSSLYPGKTHQDINLQNFFMKDIQLGSTGEVKTIQFKNEPSDAQLNHLKLTYMCNDQWVIASEDDSDVEFIVFNEEITAGFLQGYDLMTFYVGVVLAVGTLFRANALFITPLAFIYEISDPDAILTLAEYIIQMRYEGNTVKEEESYMMLVEIIRSPELCKALTGSSLKGEMGPKREKES